MEKTDSYLLLLAGLLVLALVVIELVPIPEPVTVQQPNAGGGHRTRPASVLNSGTIASLFIMPTSTLATVTVS